MTADLNPELYQDLIGAPWKKGGRDVLTGVDCYGLVREMFKRMGKIVPDFESPGTKEKMEQVIDREVKNWRRVERVPGVCILMRVEGYRTHVGFQVSQGKFLHATDPIGVCLTRNENFPNVIAAYDYVA